MRIIHYLFLVSVIAVTVGVAPAVTVQNHSFEADGALEPGVPTGWTLFAGAEADVGASSGGSTTAPDGSYYLWLGNGVILSQTTNAVISSAGASYTLTVDVKNDWNGNPQIILYYEDGESHVPLGEAHYLSTDFPPPEGSDEGDRWAEPQTLELTIETTAASVGKNIGIELLCENYPGDVWGHFDNVRLVNNTVRLISPDDGVEFVDRYTDIEWSVAPTVDKVDLYLGTQDDPNLTLDPLIFVPDIPAATTSYSPTLDFSETYYWKVVAYEPNTLPGATDYVTNASDVWSFTTTGPSPNIQSMTPYAQSVPADTGADPTIMVGGINLEDYEWYKDDVLLTNNAKYGGLGTATLTINDMTLADEGIYSCVVSNSLSEDTDVATAVVVTERLMSWWKLDGTLDDSVQEVISGVMEFDGTVDPNTVFTTDNSGIDGGDSVVLDIDDPNCPFIQIDGTEEFFNFYEDTFTVSAWIRTSYVNDSAWPAVISKQPVEGSGYVVALDGESETLTEMHGTRIYSDGPVVADGQWHMLTLTYDGSVQRVYVDGQLQATSAATSADAYANTAPVVFGAWDLESPDADFEGNIDNVKIYSYAMTSIEVGEAFVGIHPDVDYVCNYELPELTYDFDGNCRVDLADFAEIAGSWLACNRIPDTTCSQ